MENGMVKRVNQCQNKKYNKLKLEGHALWR